jgi:hypothetical protein
MNGIGRQCGPLTAHARHGLPAPLLCGTAGLQYSTYEAGSMSGNLGKEESFRFTRQSSTLLASRCNATK